MSAREKDWLVASLYSPWPGIKPATWTRDQTRNLGMCPDGDLNLQPLGTWDNAPINWATVARAWYLYGLNLHIPYYE